MPIGFANTFAGPQALLVGAVLIVFFIVRQFRTRAIFGAWNLLAPVVLLYFALQGLDQLDSSRWLLLAMSLSLAIVFGVARGMTFRVWTSGNGQMLMRGGALTLVLWVATIAVKVLVSFVEIKLGLGTGASSTESLLAGAVTIATQILVVYVRGQAARGHSLLEFRAS